MMTYRRFAIGFFFTAALFVLVNATVWIFFTRDILTRHGDIITGDLTRIGYITDLAHPRKNITDLPRLHLESGNYHGQAVDMLTIGDSFSNGASGGRNRFYQDYIATELDWTVLNLVGHPDGKNDIEAIAMLANSGFLQEARVRYVLLEATQRRAVARLTRTIDLERQISRDRIDEYYRFGDGSPGGSDFALPGIGFINDGNFTFLLYSALYTFRECTFKSATCRVTLKTPRFSMGDGREMLFYKKDIRAIRHSTPEQVGDMNDNLNALAARLGNIGITLLFMPAVNKFDLYRNDIANDDFPHDPFFELLRRQQRDYLLVDTKAILSEGLREGEQDLFFVDDTHWGPRASQRIAKAIHKLVQGQ